MGTNKIEKEEIKKIMSYLGKRSLKTMTKKQRIDRARKAGKSKKRNSGKNHDKKL